MSLAFGPSRRTSSLVLDLLDVLLGDQWTTQSSQFRLYPSANPVDTLHVFGPKWRNGRPVTRAERNQALVFELTEDLADWNVTDAHFLQQRGDRNRSPPGATVPSMMCSRSWLVTWSTRDIAWIRGELPGRETFLPLPIYWCL